MKDFLNLVADSLRSHFDNKELSRTIVIFPNKRASLFLDKYLIKENETSIWTPTYMSISDFFLSLVKQQVADPIETICRLYKIFKQAIPESKESLDHFYGWGERLLADFDDLDKNLGDAAKIFKDMKEYEEIGTDDFLTDEQREQLKKFAQDFKEKYDDGNKGIRHNFKLVWDKLLTIYTQLHEELAANGLAYEGQLHREVVEGLADGSIALPAHYKHIAFVGFNVLNNAEKKLFELLKEKELALFYWDYDLHYTKELEGAPVEAGTFLKKNLVDFPNQLNEADFNNLTHRCEGEELNITYAQASTNSVQAAYVKQWLLNTKEKHINLECAQRTAIVLCDETMLQPVLHALPSQREMKNAHGNGYYVNITNGFPVSHTPAYAFVVKKMEDYLDELDKRKAEGETNTTFFVEQVTTKVEGLRKAVQTEALKVQQITAENSANRILYTEAYFRVYSVLTRFMTLIENGIFSAESGLMSIGYSTLFKLIRQVLRGFSIPFHGEPAIGLQVMGVLETRCLDFDNILMLSVGEGILPQKESEASFIPFLIRQKYDLTTYVRKNSVYAYYFFRLLQRAKHVTLAYNNSTAGTQHGEMSRFMRNMLIDPKLSVRIARKELACSPQQLSEKPTRMPKEKHFEKDFISPSQLNDYMFCRRMFYYKYVEEIPVPNEERGLVDPRDLGTLVHKMAELFYAKYKHDGVLCSELKKIVEAKDFDKKCDDLLEQAYKGVQQDQENRLKSQEQTSSSEPTIQEVRTEMLDNSVLGYFKMLLNYEAGNASSVAPSRAFKNVNNELRKSIRFNLPSGKTITLSGVIDRTDEAEINGKMCLRVIDYKTGRSQEITKEIEDLFEVDAKKRDKYAFQALLYCLMLYKSGDTKWPIVPALFYIPLTYKKDYTPYLQIGDVSNKGYFEFTSQIAQDFEKKLIDLLQEITSTDNAFVTNKNLSDCMYCQFKQLCEDAKERYQNF